MSQLPPDPFTIADSLQLQRLQSARSSAQSQVDDGTLTPEEGEQYHRMIGARMQPLQQRQQAAQQQAQGQAALQVAHTSAQAEAIQHGNAVYRARNFHDRVVPYTDELTGQTAHLYESQPNHWEQIEFPEPGGSGESSDSAGGGEGAQVGGYFPLAVQEVPGSDQDEAGTYTDPFTGKQVPKPVWTGPSEEQLRAMPDYDPAQAARLGGGQIGRAGVGTPTSPGAGVPGGTGGGPGATTGAGPVPGTAGVPGGGVNWMDRLLLSEADEKTLRNRAMRQVGKVQLPPGGIRSPEQAHAIRQELRDKRQRVDELVQSWAGHIMSARAAESGRGQQDLEKQQEAQRKEQETQTKALGDGYRYHLGEITKEVSFWNDPNKAMAKNAQGDLVPIPDSQRPDYTKSRKGVENEAWRRARDEHQQLFPNSQAPGAHSSTRPVAAATPPAAPAAPAGPAKAQGQQAAAALADPALFDVLTRKRQASLGQDAAADAAPPDAAATGPGPFPVHEDMPREMTQAVATRPSSIHRDKVSALAVVAARALQDQWDGKGPAPGFFTQTHQATHEISEMLGEARARGRTLSVAERAVYERRLSSIADDDLRKKLRLTD